MYGYVYKTTNNINGKIYIGQKHSPCVIKTYFGSGKLIRKAINKYGKEAFSIEVLGWCSDKKSLDQFERDCIAQFNSTDKNIGYNIALGGQGGNLGPEVCLKISQKLKGHEVSPETRLKISEEHKSRHYTIQHTAETINKISEGQKAYWANLSPEAYIERCSKHPGNRKGTSANKVAITSGTDVKFIDRDCELPLNYVYGNGATKGSHDMSNYYNNPEAMKRNSLSKSGSKNSMFGHGERISGDKNGKAKYDYYYKDLKFTTRDALYFYIKNILEIDIPINTITKICKGNYTALLIERYTEDLVKSIKRELKIKDN